LTSEPKGDHAFTQGNPYGTHVEPMYSGALSFMRRRYSRDLKGVDLAVAGIPFDTATTNRPGARFGPRAIRAASTNLSWERAWPWTFDPFDRLHVVDYGDCVFDHGRPDGVPVEIEAFAADILAQDTAMLTLGGDHFITYPLLKAHAAVHGPLSLIHFDAHSDSWQDETGRIDHGTMFFHAAKDGIVDPARSVQIGLRTTNDQSVGYNILDARWVHREGVDAVVEAIRDAVGTRKCYLTFDIDCLDPAYAPGTGTPVCGGLTIVQALEILRGLTGIELVGMDLVEVSPPYDSSDITALAGSTLALEMLCVYASRFAEETGDGTD
jgi:agmatinase